MQVDLSKSPYVFGERRSSFSSTAALTGGSQLVGFGKDGKLLFSGVDYSHNRRRRRLAHRPLIHLEERYSGGGGRLSNSTVV